MNTQTLEKLDWIDAGAPEDFIPNAGIAVKAGERQIAVFYFSDTGEWYACQNRCPHKGDMLLARGLIGDKKSEPIVACPMHKKVFSLKHGGCLNDAAYSVDVYPVKIENERVLVGLPQV